MADDLLALADCVGDALDLSGGEVSNLKESAPLIARLPAIPSSNGDTHKYVTYTQSPVSAFRSPNAGKAFDHSVDAVVTVTLKLIDASWAVDKAIADRWRQGGPDALIAREGMRHIGNALWKLEQQTIYGTGADAAGFAALADNAALDAAADAMVIDAGGTTASTASSCYLLRVDPEEVAFVYAGDGPVIQLGDTTIQDIVDGSGDHFPVYYTPACLWVGFQIGGAYSAARIASLTEDSGKGLTDDLLSQGFKLFPAGRPPNLIVTNSRSLYQLQASRTATNATGAPAPWPSEWNGIPILRTDAITETEALL